MDDCATGDSRRDVRLAIVAFACLLHQAEAYLNWAEWVGTSTKTKQLLVSLWQTEQRQAIGEVKGGNTHDTLCLAYLCLDDNSLEDVWESTSSFPA